MAAIRSVSILIPTHNREVILRETLESLAKIDLPDGVAVELVVLANACTDGTVAVAREMLPSMPFPAKVVEEATPGLCLARNRAVENSGGEVCAFLDDDVQIDRRWLVELCRSMERNDIDILGGRIHLWWRDVPAPPWLTPIIRGLLSESDRGDLFKRLPDTSGVVGANFAFRRAVFDRPNGPFNTKIGRVGTTALIGNDETDFVRRAQEAGFVAGYEPACVVQHYVSPNRLTQPYLCKVAWGNGMSRIVIRKQWSPAIFARALAGY